MRIWRICAKSHLRTAFSGIGAEQCGGRWNNRGERMVYTSSTSSLAALELFVHLEPSELPANLYAVAATLPDRVTREELTAEDLPKNWRSYPAPAVLQEIGSKWLKERRSLVLVVPSAVNPAENNILLNPQHPEIELISDIQSKPFRFDPRMWKLSQ